MTHNTVRYAFSTVGRITDLSRITYAQSYPNANFVLFARIGRLVLETRCTLESQVEGGHPWLVSSAKMNASCRDIIVSTTTDRMKKVGRHEDAYRPGQTYTSYKSAKGLSDSVGN